MKNEAVDNTGMRMIAGTGVTFLQHTINVLLLVLKYSFLFILLFLLASHENANPKLGKTNIEFYSAEFRNVMVLKENAESVIMSSNTSQNEEVNYFYQNRQYMPAWTTNFEVNSTFRELMELLKNSYNYGLLPSSYNYSFLYRLQKQLKSPLTDHQKTETRVQLERYATWASMHFMSHIAYGIRQQDTTVAYQEFVNSLPAYLQEILESSTLSEGILDLQPESRQYTRLQRAAARYMSRAKADTTEYTIEELERDENLITRRLINQGYLDEGFINDSIAIQTAIRNFQRTHYLEITGVADQLTLNMLTNDIKDDFFKIAVNLDRLRKDALRNESYILVNIPEFKLHYYDELGKCTDFNVIIGKEDTPTPLLTSQIECIIANPYWTVPQSISRNEIIPLIKKDSLYLEKNRFSVVDKHSKPVDISAIDWSTVNADEFIHWFKQDNENSSLGAIKFLFPNEHAVYLHDTPGKKLFEKRIRTFSHGCVRVQNPEVLAQIIIATYCKSSKDIDVKSMIKRKSYKEIKIEKSLPIHIRYYSCTVDSLGDIYYHPDIYAMDDAVIKELFGKVAWEL